MKDSTKHKILDHLQKNTTAMLGTVEGVSEVAFLHKSSADKWSIAEVIEHVISVETGIMGNLQRLGAAPGEKTLDTPPTTEEIISRSADRTDLAISPAQFIPKGVFSDKSEAIVAFQNHRATVTQFVGTTTLPLQHISFPHPRLGLFNGENWLAFMVGHCQRHINQIDMIKRGMVNL